jgi:predicted DNA-binding protein
MLKYKERVTVRLTSTQLQILKELSAETNTTVSITLRKMIAKALEDAEEL